MTATKSQPKKLRKGDILFEENDEASSMFLIKKGRLSVFRDIQGIECELAQLGPGEVVGEMSFFDHKPRSASVKIVEDAELMELSFSSLRPQYETSPDWIKAIIKTISEHLRQANNRIEELEKAR